MKCEVRLNDEDGVSICKCKTIETIDQCPKWRSHCADITGDLGKERLKRWVFKRFLRKQSVTAPIWSSAAECSTAAKQRPKKLDRRWTMVERRVHSTRSDDDEAESANLSC